MWKTMLALGVAAVLVIGSPEDGAAQQAIDKAAGEIFGTVMSPFCPGMTLATCPSSQAAELRDNIREQLARGASTEEVLDELYAVWGEEVLGPRSALGAGLLAWLIPAVVIVVAGAGLLAWLRGSSRRFATGATGGDALDPKDRERLERELAQI
jgi:cytochrome c-type biogenesis protein CcmH